MNQQKGIKKVSSLVSTVSQTSTDSLDSKNSKNPKNPEKPKKQQKRPRISRKPNDSKGAASISEVLTANGLKAALDATPKKIPNQADETPKAPIVDSSSDKKADAISQTPPETKDETEEKFKDLDEVEAKLPSLEEKLDYLGFPFDPVSGRLTGTDIARKGKCYFELVQWFTGGNKFTQTLWNKKFQVKHDSAKLNLLFRMLANNVKFIENGFLCDRRFEKDTPGYLLITIRDAKIIYCHEKLWEWHQSPKTNVDLRPILDLVKHQFDQK